MLFDDEVLNLEVGLSGVEDTECALETPYHHLDWIREQGNRGGWSGRDGHVVGMRGRRRGRRRRTIELPRAALWHTPAPPLYHHHIQP